MVVIKSVSAKEVFDSRKEKTISVSIKTDYGVFSASAPNGKSKGKAEKNPYKQSLEKDIASLKKFKEYFNEDIIETFDDLRRIEDIVEGHIGANTTFALESAVLKALAKEKKKEIWELINPKANYFPRLVGNSVGGGKHSEGVEPEGKKPDFQEFLIIPETRNVKNSFKINKEVREKIGEVLKRKDEHFSGKITDENAWLTSLDDKEVLEILKKFDSKIKIGVDIAASSFYKRKKYNYNNPRFQRISEEQKFYVSNLVKNFGILYVEDPFDEEDFKGFAELVKTSPNSLIVGDDLIATNFKRFEKALKNNSVNAIIVKPNQIGSLIEVKKICELAKKKKIKIVFSHRSGETNENILADLAFGFQADFFKCGIVGKERESKIKRLIEIEKTFK
jgi:enolase